MIIAVDFDGTCVTHEFPKVGKEIGASHVLKALTDNGHKLILYTMRSHPDLFNQGKTLSGEVVNNDTLQDAINWFKEKNIPLYGVNENPSQKRWTSSPKVYAHLYIDDAALGVPTKSVDLELRPFVNWSEVAWMLFKYNLITSEQCTEMRHLIADECKNVELLYT